ncbi:3-isopropylmalate dehydratase large subunit [Ruminococcaceae bacterium OttesenSCG-928-I18]|nr:3-isopropylmalate dehydratase large subunit [Ruminococcaceae bacterium OttesenSCG-928-I18]
MPMTVAEKILARNIGAKSVRPGEIITVRPDRVMIHDIFIPFVAEKFEQMGFSKVWDPDKVVLVYDHLVPTAVTDDVRHHKAGDAFANQYGLTHVHRADGICHQLMVELGYVKPGDVAFGTDSHTVTYGAVGAFATGIGYTEMAAVLGTGELWVRVPETIRVEIEGELPAQVFPKDIILRLIGDLGADGATYKALEIVGSTAQAMSLSSRMTIANMAIEAGAKCAVFAPDETSLEYSGPVDFDLSQLQADEGARYAQVLRYRAEAFEPVAACPSQVDKIRPVRELLGTAIDEVFIGSCTNGRLEDLRVAAEILRGKQVSPFTRLIVTPASRAVYGQAAEEGLLSALLDAGAMVTLPGCGLCCGRAGGIVASGETVLATNNRNFLGRMGDKTSKIYLASPAVAAATALQGKITLP